MSVFALRESRGTTHRFGSVSTTLNGGLNAVRLGVWPIPPWVAVGVGRGGAECEDACRGCSVHALAFAAAVKIESRLELCSKTKGASSLVKRTMSGEESYHEKERGCTHWLQMRSVKRCYRAWRDCFGGGIRA